MSHVQLSEEDYSDQRVEEVCASLQLLQQFVARAEALQLSARELAHLRALALFSPGNCSPPDPHLVLTDCTQ